MAKFKVIVSDPITAKSSVSELEGAKAQALIGRTLGEIVDGSPLGVAGRKLRITGGCDKDGIPMRIDVHGGGKKYLVLAGGVGYRPEHEGARRRKLVRGKTITDETYQINAVIVKEEDLPKEKPKPVPAKEVPKRAAKKLPKKAKPSKKK